MDAMMDALQPSTHPASMHPSNPRPLQPPIRPSIHPSIHPSAMQNSPILTRRAALRKSRPLVRLFPFPVPVPPPFPRPGTLLWESRLYIGGQMNFKRERNAIAGTAARPYHPRLTCSDAHGPIRPMWIVVPRKPVAAHTSTHTRARRRKASGEQNTNRECGHDGRRPPTASHVARRCG